MKKPLFTRKSVLTLVLGSALATGGSAFASLTDMTWTPGGNTATISDGPLTADMGTVDSSGTTPGSMNVVLTTNPGDAEVGALWFDGNFIGGPLTSQTIRLAYDVTVNTQPSVATGQPKLLDQSLMGGSATAGQAGILMGMNIAATVADGPWAFRFALAPTGADSGVFAMRSPDNSTLMAFAGYTAGQTYSVLLDANYSTGCLTAYIDGNLALSGYQFRPGTEGVSTSEVFIHLNGEDGYANSVRVGNFSVATLVPEPSTCVLGGLSLLSFGVSRTRRMRNSSKA